MSFIDDYKKKYKEGEEPKSKDLKDLDTAVVNSFNTGALDRIIKKDPNALSYIERYVETAKGCFEGKHMETYIVNIENTISRIKAKVEASKNGVNSIEDSVKNVA